MEQIASNVNTPYKYANLINSTKYHLGLCTWFPTLIIKYEVTNKVKGWVLKNSGKFSRFYLII